MFIFITLPNSEFLCQSPNCVFIFHKILAVTTNHNDPEIKIVYLYGSEKFTINYPVVINSDRKIIMENITNFLKRGVR